MIKINLNKFNLIMKNIILIVALSLCIRCNGQNKVANFSTYINSFEMCIFPFNSFEINRGKSYQNGDKKHLIDRNVLTDFFISDTTELGYNYSVHGMDDYNKIYTGYVTIDYYLYSWYCIDSSYYGVIYEKRDQDESNYFLSIFNNKGLLYDKLMISNETLDESFTESLIVDRLNIKKVNYEYINNNKSKILEQDYRFNLEKKHFELVKEKSFETNHFYYKYLKHNIIDDPLYIPTNVNP